MEQRAQSGKLFSLCARCAFGVVVGVSGALWQSWARVVSPKFVEQINGVRRVANS